MLISCFSLSFRVFRCFYRNFVKILKYFLRSNQLARGVVCRAIILFIDFPNRIVYDKCTGARQCVDIEKILKLQAKFWYQTRSNP